MSKLTEYKNSLAQAESMFKQCEEELKQYKALKRAARPNEKGRIAHSDSSARLKVAQYEAAIAGTEYKIAILKQQIKALKECIKAEEKAQK